MTDRPSKPGTEQPDALRRKLAKAGVAAPIVLASLVSKPVLGAAPHNCTISGQLSGNVSTHLQGDCRLLGKTPSYYASLPPASWPNAANDFLNAGGNPRQFFSTPYSFKASARFSNAYEKEKIAGVGTPVGTVSPATAWDVLAGFVVVASTGIQNSQWMLRARPGYFADLELGREALAAYMNAYSKYPDYPLTPAEVATMFNAVVVSGGSYQIAPGVLWYAADVLNYFRSLRS